MRLRCDGLGHRGDVLEVGRMGWMVMGWGVLEAAFMMFFFVKVASTLHCEIIVAGRTG